MKIIYKDEHGIMIEEHEVLDNEYFIDPEYIEGKFKTKEIVENEKLTDFTIFYDKKINHTEILKNEKYSNISISIGERIYLGIYRHEKIYNYDINGNLTTIFNRVFDSDNNVIVSSFTYDTINEIPYWNGTSKYYYDKSIRPDDSLFECYYDDNGILIPITIDVEELGLGDHDGTWVYNNEEGIKDLMQIFNMPKSLAEFYVSSEIIPKNVAQQRL